MYRAKENGRDRFELFKAELQAQMQKQADLEDALRTALGSNQLRLVFSPSLPQMPNAGLSGPRLCYAGNTQNWATFRRPNSFR